MRARVFAEVGGRGGVMPSVRTSGAKRRGASGESSGVFKGFTGTAVLM